MQILRQHTEIRKNKEKGAALIISLILLTVITLLTLSAMHNTNLDTKIAANHQHKQISFQAAESALAKFTAEAPELSDAGAGDTAVLIPLTTELGEPGAKENENYYVATEIDQQPDSSANLTITYEGEANIKISGNSLSNSYTVHLYTLDAIGKVEGSNTETHNRMQVGYVVNK